MFASFNARAVGLSLDPYRTIELAAKSGFQGVDLMVRDLVETGAELRLVRDSLQRHGLRPGAFPLPLNWRAPEAGFRHHLEKLPIYAEAAASLGLTRTATWVFPDLLRPGDTSSDAPAEPSALFDWHVSRLGDVARRLADHDIMLGLEAIGVATFRMGSGIPFLNRLAKLGPLIEALRAEVANVGLLVDSFHLFAGGESADVLSAYGPGDVVWVHVADPAADALADRDQLRDDQRSLPAVTGAGRVPELLRRLERLGYDGPVTVETFELKPLEPASRLVEEIERVALAIQDCWPHRQVSGSG